MLLRVYNDTGRKINMKIDNQFIDINQTLELELVNNYVSIVIMTYDASSFSKDEKKCFITTNISFDLICDGDIVILNLSSVIRKYQNYTQYCYFVPNCINGRILNIKYCVNDSCGVEKVIKQQFKQKKTSRIFSVLGWCIFDTILDGGILSIILSIVFSLKVAIIGILIIYVIELIVNYICITLDKSRHRVLNWAKDPSSYDDVIYLMQHIQKFCK